MLREDARLAQMRSQHSELENHLIDELLAARVDRRGFVRRATVLGMSMPAVAAVLSACGSDDGPSAGTGTGGGTGAGVRGGLLRAGAITPGRAVDPLKLGDTGSVTLLSQTGEYLALSYGEPDLKPVLAESWEPNADSSVWTFKIRQGVRFNDGRPMTTRDVAATFNRLADPRNGTNALEVFDGILSPGGTRAVDATTVVFELDQANGSWPWLVSSDNSSAIILPADYDGDWESTFIGTGPWRKESYTPKVRASFVRNDDYWGEPALADRLEYTLFEDEVAMVLALQAGNVDLIGSFSVGAGQSLLRRDGRFTVNAIKSAAHSNWTLRTDRPPLDDPRVRRALALSLNRDELVRELLKGYADLGNDSPFAPVFPMTNTDVPQRAQDIEQAKALLSQAGLTDGFDLEVTVWNVGVNAAYAQLAQNSARDAGIRLRLTMQDTATFLGTGEFGSSPQLDVMSGIGDWGSRGVPNAYLTAQLSPGGVRNAAHWRSADYARLLRTYMGESDLQAQRRTAGQIQELLLEQTPVIYAFFPNYLTATTASVQGVVPTAMGHMLLAQASRA
ncbi:ABC transporter substrate-binding protein [Conexibacter sp. CPCC 206217]|uniref:ABC transporter substrate-binding protein n=1 Tax=Conexibacter sp. CPCC 206217 TaxID=3064574 RepID=UPI002720D2FF|nr:ABC transporter substrate-binding protein [Conexibacter sp. CPCC 206217]MDO8210243.1 ABC transporter substrate-binding protein [Conexibacter sp. CPCC 206217]